MGGLHSKQFTLRTAAIGIAVLGILFAGIDLYSKSWAEKRAHDTYDHRLAEFDAAMLSDPIEICRAARVWNDSQSRLPWRNESKDYDAYLDSLREIEARLHYSAEN